MTIRYYLDIQLNAQHDMDVKTKTQVFSNIHRLLKHHGIKDVALGFPSFGKVNAVGLPGLGEHLRLVSKNQDSLNLIKNNVTHRTLHDMGIVKFGVVTQVPDDANEVRFYRDQSPGRVKKGIKRRGEPSPGKHYDGIDRESAGLLIQRTDGSKYPIFIGLLPATERVDGAFSTYGLSTKSGPTFPNF
ncbi:type I-F CRISPR-associated endoribonuclease Cas6/Csy4 [Pseudomonas sp. Leaf58]|uniref:type I-F CRISPR-associated endoribonuclease Cas6/Csy4 n=1 Tax=Pseudomonas sp. Leaf58 TaxID=1736226 RepID=UPI0006FAFFFB|nr:type I-F CRISPR-associated endoribonuclease Cas6/Csy4 [Pseudomonas sp. Leaf58]KQN62606.1 hypothetical protein ASF02_10695 [Pseudomonas sp. Leaf58]